MDDTDPQRNNDWKLWKMRHETAKETVVITKEAKMKNKVLIVNATKHIKEGIAQSFLTQNHIEKIAGVVNTYSEEDLFSRIVDKEEIVENGYNLNIIRYVRTEPPPAKIDIQKYLQKLHHIKSELDHEYQQFQSLFEEMK